MKKIGILGIRGLPANYGAFDQTAFRLLKFAAEERPDLKFFVLTDSVLRDREVMLQNLRRVFYYNLTPALSPLVQLFFSVYFRIYGVKTIYYFGYSSAPFFWFYQFIGIKVICNVDGFEWRRSKWSGLVKRYFLFCEYSVGKNSKVKIITDSPVITRYYNIHFGKSGYELFYGSDNSENLINHGPFNIEINFKDYFIAVMRLEPENNIEMILKAFSESKGCNLVLVGPATPFFEKIWPQFKDCQNIQYLGPVYDKPLLNFLRKGAVSYIHGHSVGGTNPTLVEAVSLGLNVISFKTSFNSYVLGQDGLYFRSSGELSQILMDFDPLDVHRQRNLDFRFEWTYICRKYLELL